MGAIPGKVFLLCVYATFNFIAIIPQYVITLGFFPFNFFLGYVYLSPILTLFPPPHWCAVPALSHLSREQRKELAIPRLENAGRKLYLHVPEK